MLTSWETGGVIMSDFKCTVCEDNGDASACELQTIGEDSTPEHCPWELDNEAAWKKIE